MAVVCQDGDAFVHDDAGSIVERYVETLHSNVAATAAHARAVDAGCGTVREGLSPVLWRHKGFKCNVHLLYPEVNKKKSR